MLVLSDLSSSDIRIVATLITTYKILCHIHCVGILRFYRRTKFHLPSSTDSLVIAVELKTKEFFRTICFS